MESITDYIKKAFEYKNVGDYKKSIDYFYKALAIENDSSEILKELALLYSALCQYDRAVALYEQVISKSPDNYGAKLTYAQLCIKMKNFQKAKELLSELFIVSYDINAAAEELFHLLFKENDFEQIISQFKTSKQEITSSSALYFVGLAYSKISCFDTAEEYFNKAFSVSENNIDAGYNLAKVLFNKGLYSESEKLLLNLLKFSEDDRVFALLAEISYVNKNLEDAIKYYSYAIRVNPKEAEHLYKLGVVYSLKGFMNEAEQSYCRAVTLDSENVLYNYTLAYFYYTNNKIQLAEHLADYILAINSNHTNTLSLKVLLFVRNNEIALAKGFVEKVEKSVDKDDFSYYALTSYYSKLNLWEKAITACQKAIELNPSSIEYKYALAKIYFDTNGFDSAFSLCGEIIAENDKYIQAYILRAKIMMIKENYNQAQADIETALKLDMNAPEAHYVKGCINFNTFNYEQALESFKTAVSISPNEVKYYAWTAMAYYKSENYIDAYSYFKEASQMDISNPEYRYYMAKCCINNNDKEEAIANFSVLRRLAPSDVDYAEEYAQYLSMNGNKKAALSVLKSTLKLVVTKEEKEQIKKNIENLKKRC